MASNELVPSFQPPLANLLAHAERLKGAPLNEDEVLRVRDNATCIMLQRSMALQMDVQRGFRDVEPENCWADWHRLRVQTTRQGYLPKIVLCLLGEADLAEKCRPVLEGLEHEWTDADARMQRAFQASARGWNSTLHPDDWSAVAEHQKVLYVLSSNFTAAEALPTSWQFLQTGGKLLAAGATAIKCESSGLAHGAAHWQKLVRRSAPKPPAGEAAPADTVDALIDAYVQHPLRDEGDLYTCGMHLLGAPDLIVSIELLNQSFTKALAVSGCATLFRSFANYLLGECPPGSFHAGHTFSVSPKEPRFRLAWEACRNYAQDDFFFNPFGRWRFTPA